MEQLEVPHVAGDNRSADLPGRDSRITLDPAPVKAERAQLFERLQRTFAPHPKLRCFTKTFHNATGDIGGNGKPAGQIYHLCPYPWTMLQIASNGNVVPCCRDLRQKTVLGNLMRDELSDIWNGEEFRKLRRHLVDEEPDKIAACVGCDLPWDDSKFTVKNVVKTIKGRLQGLPTSARAAGAVQRLAPGAQAGSRTSASGAQQRKSLSRSVRCRRTRGSFW